MARAKRPGFATPDRQQTTLLLSVSRPSLWIAGRLTEKTRTLAVVGTGEGWLQGSGPGPSLQLSHFHAIFVPVVSL